MSDSPGGSPFTDQNGNINLVWHQFLVSLWKRTGASGGNVVNTVIGLHGDITLLQLEAAGLAPIDSPHFTGTPTAPTAAINTDTLQLASTAFVLNQAASTVPVMDGTGQPGISLTYARGDHVHPSDTSKLSLTGGTMTGAIVFATNATGIDWSDLMGGHPRLQIDGSGLLKLYRTNSTGGLSTVFSVSTGTTAPATDPFTILLPLQTNNLLIDASASTSAPSSGATLAVPSGVARVIVKPAATLASLTIVSPVAPVGVVAAGVVPLSITFLQAVTALTWTAGAGTSYSGAALPSTAAVGAVVELLWIQSSGQWFHGLPV